MKIKFLLLPVTVAITFFIMPYVAWLSLFVASRVVDMSWGALFFSYSLLVPLAVLFVTFVPMAIIMGISMLYENSKVAACLHTIFGLISLVLYYYAEAYAIVAGISYAWDKAPFKMIVASPAWVGVSLVPVVVVISPLFFALAGHKD